MNTISPFDFFDSMWRDFEHAMYKSPRQIFQTSYPPMNVWADEETKDLYLEFAIAGIPKENVKVDVEGEYLTLEIDKALDEKEGFTLVQKGIKTAKAKNRYLIPVSKYDTENIKAEMRDGILAVRIPAKEKLRPRQILIE